MLFVSVFIFSAFQSSLCAVAFFCHAYFPSLISTLPFTIVYYAKVDLYFNNDLITFCFGRSQWRGKLYFAMIFLILTIDQRKGLNRLLFFEKSSIFQRGIKIEASVLAADCHVVLYVECNLRYGSPGTLKAVFTSAYIFSHTRIFTVLLWHTCEFNQIEL